MKSKGNAPLSARLCVCVRLFLQTTHTSIISFFFFDVSEKSNEEFSKAGKKKKRQQMPLNSRKEFGCPFSSFLFIPCTRTITQLELEKSSHVTNSKKKKDDRLHGRKAK
jgi:hypothetical protein